jgi:hypothetical protein
MVSCVKPDSGEYQDKTIPVILERLKDLEDWTRSDDDVVHSRLKKLEKDLLEKECGLIDFVKGHFLDKCQPINVVLDNHDNRIEKLEDIIDATEKVSLQTSLPDAIKEIERRLNVICQINSNHLGRIKELEENHEASRDTIGCVDSAYDEVCKKLEKRIEKLEEDIVKLIRGIEGFHHDRLMALESSISKSQQNPVPSSSHLGKCTEEDCNNERFFLFKLCETCFDKRVEATRVALTASPIQVSIRKLEDKVTFFGEWIPIKVRLPEEDELVLVCAGDSAGLTTRAQFGTYEITPTHWCRLPNIPGK